LKIVLVIIFFLDDLKVIFIKLFILIFSLSVLSELVILLNSVIRVIVNVNEKLGKSINAILIKDAFTNLINNFFGSLDLANQSISFCLLVNGLPEALKEESGHCLELDHS
jgi:short subunit fatty acids transporter